MTRPEQVSAAEHFWRRAELGPIDSHNLEHGVCFAFDVPVETHANLSVWTIQRWLDRHDYPLRIVDHDRRLRGCAVATQGSGLIFIDADDPVDEREFTLAHEVAHLLLDYFGPRDHTVALIRDRSGAVFDGLREPDFDERLSAALHGEDLRPFVHLLARDVNRSASAAFIRRERLADELACELLAPMADVQIQLRREWDQTAITSLLTTRYRLPYEPAADYARRLSRRFLPAPTFVDWLRV